MLEGDRKDRFEAQTREQFEALGRFVQAFEQMIHTIRSAIEARLQQESRNMVYFTRMLFHHRSLTAWPLWEMFRGIVYTDVSELRPASPPDADQFHGALTKIGNEVSALLSARNSILHGTPFIGWISAEQEDFTRMQIVKWDVSAKGWKETETPTSATELLALVNRCKGAEDAIRRISFASGMSEGEARKNLLTRSLEALTKRADCAE